MQEDNNKTNDNSQDQTLAEASNTTKGTAEHGALKEIHREYNKLNGYEAMLHIINRFRFVLYPFIFLSIMGSSYSFYNDFIKSFPMNVDWLNLSFAIFLSVMLEIVRDGSLIALFVKKMNIASRLLVVAIFLSVTTYMYSSHLQAIKVIEEMTVKYTLNHQTTSSVSKSNPEIAMTAQNLADAKKDLKDTKAEYKKQLDISANAKYAVNKTNAQKQLPILKADEKEYQAKVTAYQNKLLALQHKNIDDVTDSQKIISRILLSTLILIESLAMLGAVIKFIHSDNAKAEIAKHSEIVEEYIEISEQMKADNEELTKNLSNVVKGQSEANQKVMKMISDDMQETANLNIQFIKAIADNKRDTMKQMNEVLQMINQATIPTFNPQPIPIMAEREEGTRQIGFKANSKEEIVTRLFQGGTVEPNEKLTTKDKVVGKPSRSRNEAVSEVYKILSKQGAIEREGNKGYFAKTDYQTALKMLY